MHSKKDEPSPPLTTMIAATAVCTGGWWFSIAATAVLSYWTVTKTVFPIAALQPKLRFSAGGKFKILQLTDLHIGENAWEAWGPAADAKTFDSIRKVVQLEQPNLIVFSGDQLTANNVDGRNATDYYRLLQRLMELDLHCNYCFIFGNHDDAPYWRQYSNGTIRTHAARTTRRDLMQLFTSSKSRYSYTRTQSTTTKGMSNYMLSVHHDNDIRLQVVLLDSGGGSIDTSIGEDHFRFYETNRMSDVDAVAFQHVPTQEFSYQEGNDDDDSTTSSYCQGYNGEGGIAPLEYDKEHEVSFLLQEDPKLHFLAVGHNHGNSYCCSTGTSSSGSATTTASLHLCFGRHSGYGGYSKSYWTKGARVFEFQLLEDNEDSSLSWKSHVRLDTGTVTDEYDPLSSINNNNNYA